MHRWRTKSEGFQCRPHFCILKKHMSLYTIYLIIQGLVCEDWTRLIVRVLGVFLFNDLLTASSTEGSGSGPLTWKLTPEPALDVSVCALVRSDHFSQVTVAKTKIYWRIRQARSTLKSLQDNVTCENAAGGGVGVEEPQTKKRIEWSRNLNPSGQFQSMHAYVAVMCLVRVSRAVCTFFALLTFRISDHSTSHCVRALQFTIFVQDTRSMSPFLSWYDDH